MKIDVHMGARSQSWRAATSGPRRMVRSSVTQGTFWLKCKRSITRLRKGEIAMVFPRILLIGRQGVKVHETGLRTGERADLEAKNVPRPAKRIKADVTF